MSILLSSAVATATTIPNSTDSDSRPGAENGECRLLGPFALFVQGALGALALLSLVYKRWRERPQRPVKIWAFDASKQVVGSVLLHVANLFMSMLSSGQFTVKAGDYQANPCSFYLLNLAIDTTIGIPILIALLRILYHGFSLTPLADPPESIQSGHYGHPPRASWWLKQSFIYFIGLLGMKCCVFLIFQLCPWIIRVGDWALRWTEGNETVQVFFVMLFFPVVMNALQYYIIDSFIKNQNPTNHEPIPSDDGEDEDDETDGRHGRRRSRGGPEQYDSEDEDTAKNGETIKATELSDKADPPDRVSKSKSKPKKLDEYDPATDGDGGSSSSSSTREGDGNASRPKHDEAERPKTQV
ncbi:MAG: hypothetical protein Q9195_000177 [Heterodermia aff. obscurata]